MRKFQVARDHRIYFRFFLILSFSFCAYRMALAATTAAELTRTNEILDKEIDLRKRIERPKKAFIKDIEVEGVSLLPTEQLKEIIAPYRKKWLTEEQIGHLLREIMDVYQEISPSRSPLEIAYRIKKNILLITAQE